VSTTTIAKSDSICLCKAFENFSGLWLSISTVKVIQSPSSASEARTEALGICIILLDARRACFKTDDASGTSSSALGELLQASRAVFELHRFVSRKADGFCGLAFTHKLLTKLLYQRETCRI
jgi:hypothetical protein